MIKDDNQLALDLYRIEHPLSWKFVLRQLQKDHDETIRAAAEKLELQPTEQ